MAILVCVCACSLTDLCSALCDPVCVVAHQAPLSVEFSRQGYWTGLPFLPSGDLPDPGFKRMFPALQADSIPLSHLDDFRPNIHMQMELRTGNNKIYLEK